MNECVWSNGGQLQTGKHRRNQRTNRPIYTFSAQYPTRTSLKTKTDPKLRFFAARSKTFTQVTTDLHMMDQGSQRSAFDSIVVAG